MAVQEPSDALGVPFQDSGSVSQAIDAFPSTGPQPLVHLLSTQISTLLSSPITAVPFSQLLVSLFNSPLSLQQLVEIFSGVFTGLEEEDRIVFGESLSDVVEVLSEESEDLKDVRPSTNNEVDRSVESLDSKAIQVIRLLLVPSFSSSS
jgi:hypothetical protein